MSNLTTFQLIAGTASILSLLLVLIGYTMKLRRNFKQKRERAEQALENAIERLKSAGGTVSARTDLGFLVLIQIASLRGLLSSLNHFLTGVIVVAGFAFLASILIPSLLLLALPCSIMFVTETIYTLRWQNYVESYERRIEEVWKHPVARRVTKSTETETT